MAKVSFTKLGLNKEVKSSTITFNDVEIEVKNYLSIKDKIDLIDITLQESKEEDGYFNPIKIEMNFILNVIFLYTNINFTDKQKEDLQALYDLLEKNGLADEIVRAIPSQEYETLTDYLDETRESIERYNQTFVGAIGQIAKIVEGNANTMKEVLADFDPSKFSEVQNLYKKL